MIPTRTDIIRKRPLSLVALKLALSVSLLLFQSLTAGSLIILRPPVSVLSLQERPYRSADLVSLLLVFLFFFFFFVLFPHHLTLPNLCSLSFCLSFSFSFFLSLILSHTILFLSYSPLPRSPSYFSSLLTLFRRRLLQLRPARSIRFSAGAHCCSRSHIRKRTWITSTLPCRMAI